MRLEYTAIGVSVYWFGATMLLKDISIDAAFLSAGTIFLVLVCGKIITEELTQESTDDKEALADD